MRNIHILETDRPTRLYLPWKEGRNIYITNDEEIQEGDCFIGDNINLRKCTLNNAGNINFKGGWYSGSTNCRKIILTTDQDLIKDGVQSIDDEFLEWFVKNQSCEKVEVVDDTLTIREASKLPLGVKNHKYKIIIPKEEPKKDPLEQAAKEYAEMHLDVSGNLGKYLVKAVFQDGAKWQAERMYSEQEVLDILNNLRLDSYNYGMGRIELLEWFEQFKKK